MTDTLTPEAPASETDTASGGPTPPETPAPAPADGGKVTFTPEQQAHMEELLARRSARAAADARTKYEADLKLIAEREQMDAAARAQAEKADLEKASAEKVTAAEQRVVRSDARAELIAAGVPKASADTALRLVDLDGISPGDDGYDEAVAAACAKAIAAVPGLIPTTASGPSGGEFTPEGGGKVWTRDEVGALTPAEYDKHRSEIMKQMQTTGIK
jgi:hypothetical protein